MKGAERIRSRLVSLRRRRRLYTWVDPTKSGGVTKSSLRDPASRPGAGPVAIDPLQPAAGRRSPALNWLSRSCCRRTTDVLTRANVLPALDRGAWTEIRPDLTKNLPERRGGSGNIQYATITTIDESPIVGGVIWAGTDDGNVQVTRDGGKTWTNVADKMPGHPGHWVSRVIASHHDAATAYATATGYRSDDSSRVVEDQDDGTRDVDSRNLAEQAINVIREDLRTRTAVLGTDFGLYASLDCGFVARMKTA